MAHVTKHGLIDDVEDLEKYGKGGFYPTEIGEVLHNRYEVVDKLGYGGWSTVWLSYDRIEEKMVALKIGIADSLPGEVRVLRDLEKPKSATARPAAIPQILDEFRCESVNGSHPCYTTVPALGTLHETSFSRLFPLNVARSLAYELTLAVHYVHSQGYAHGDIHLRNVLVRASNQFNSLSIDKFREDYGEPDVYELQRTNGKSFEVGFPARVVAPIFLGKKANDFTLADARLLLSDFGESFEPARQDRMGKDCHTPVDFRPPEAKFEPDNYLSFSADIWSLATTLWDILGMQSLFCSAFYTEPEVICQIIDALGPLPANWQDMWEDHGQFFTQQGQPTPGRHVWPPLEGAFEERVQHYRRKRSMGEYGEEETAAFLDLMRQMLSYRPEHRPTIEQVLKHDWMIRWAHVNYDQCHAAM